MTSLIQVVFLNQVLRGSGIESDALNRNHLGVIIDQLRRGGSTGLVVHTRRSGVAVKDNPSRAMLPLSRPQCPHDLPQAGALAVHQQVDA